MLTPCTLTDGLFGSAFAAEAEFLAHPQISVSRAYGNKLELKIDNLSKFSSNTSFNVFIDGSYSKTYKLSTLKKSNQINLIDNGKTYFKPSSVHRVKVTAVNNGTVSSSPVITAKTDSATYYNIYKGAYLYKCSDSKLYRAGTASVYTISPCILSSTRGQLSPGQSILKNNAGCAYITGGKYKGYYIKVCSTMCRTTKRNYQVKTVVDYAASMDGGRYVWGGASYRATDCCGLTMQAYGVIGVNMPHSVYGQAVLGKSVPMSQISAGDLIICRNYGHVAMYIGNGYIVHAMNSYDGIKIQPLDRIYYCSPINSIRRIL